MSNDCSDFEKLACRKKDKEICQKTLYIYNCLKESEINSALVKDCTESELKNFYLASNLTYRACQLLRKRACMIGVQFDPFIIRHDSKANIYITCCNCQYLRKFYFREANLFVQNFHWKND